MSENRDSPESVQGEQRRDRDSLDRSGRDNEFWGVGNNPERNKELRDEKDSEDRLRRDRDSQDRKRRDRGGERSSKDGGGRRREARAANLQGRDLVVIEDETEHVGRGVFTASMTSSHKSHNSCRDVPSLENSFVMVPENDIEAHRISNNYKFGLKKWKSHVTSRPIATRSEIIQDLYSDINKVQSSKISTFRPFNIIYTLLFGWWLALVYGVVALLMFVTVVGRDYGVFCLRMGKYFFWPFGKFVLEIHKVQTHSVASAFRGVGISESGLVEESQSLLSSDIAVVSSSSYDSIGSEPHPPGVRFKCPHYWTQVRSYVWLVLAVPILWPLHAVIWTVSWFFVISIPVAKVNSKMLTRILFLPPDKIRVEDHSDLSKKQQKCHSEIIMYTHQAVNLYYYKLTVDGVNVILVNLLPFVLLSIVLSFADAGDVVTSEVTKCILGVLAIVPLTYYVGMAITSISAQSSFAIGAILNAAFGSMVEVILFIIMLKKGKDTNQECYQELVKSSLTGAILVSILFIPGISMVMGGIKFRTQNFNPKSANISAALLFVSVAGLFSPTIFGQLYGYMNCEDCVSQTDLAPVLPPATSSNSTPKVGFSCKLCTQSVFGANGDRSLYDTKVAPLVYSCAVILPIAYIVGLVFTMKTHSSEVYDEFETQLKKDISTGPSHSHGSPEWSRLRSVVILLLCAVAIALCGDIISNNIEPLLEKSGISEYFIGVTMLSLVAELPEVVNGIQFALQNNVNLGIEIGSSTAIQVCLVQVPMLVLVDLIYPMGFHLIFAEVHFWAVLFSVIVINYIFQDGKSDYFQGSIVVFIYLVLMMMYVFTIPPDTARCMSQSPLPANSTPTPATTFTTTTTAAVVEL